jgi:hypothetical protein
MVQVLAYNEKAQEEERMAERAGYRRGGYHQSYSERQEQKQIRELEEGSRNNIHSSAPAAGRGGGAGGGGRGRGGREIKDDFEIMEERARRQGGTSRGGWKGAEALGINFEL